MTVLTVRTDPAPAAGTVTLSAPRWQQWPGGDLPDELAADEPAIAVTA